jgi:hypothetical protein
MKMAIIMKLAAKAKREEISSKESCGVSAKRAAASNIIGIAQHHERRKKSAAARGERKWQNINIESAYGAAK